jgi:DNA-binding transcriptional regulator YiaG
VKGILRTRTPEEMKFAQQQSDWIRRLRALIGFTHQHMGDIAGVRGSTLQSWERGESMPTPYQLFLLRSFARGRGLETPEL